jgi:hypothetical protein
MGLEAVFIGRIVGCVRLAVQKEKIDVGINRLQLVHRRLKQMAAGKTTVLAPLETAVLIAAHARRPSPRGAVIGIADAVCLGEAPHAAPDLLVVRVIVYLPGVGNQRDFIAGGGRGGGNVAETGGEETPAVGPGVPEQAAAADIRTKKRTSAQIWRYFFKSGSPPFSGGTAVRPGQRWTLPARSASRRPRYPAGRRPNAENPRVGQGADASGSLDFHMGRDGSPQQRDILPGGAS